MGIVTTHFLYTVRLSTLCVVPYLIILYFPELQIILYKWFNGLFKHPQKLLNISGIYLLLIDLFSILTVYQYYQKCWLPFIHIFLLSNQINSVIFNFKETSNLFA